MTEDYKYSFLQEVAKHADDIQEAVAREGVFVPESAIHYLTKAQLSEVQELFIEMEMSLDYLTTSWMLTDQLNRARIANYRWSRAA